MFDSVPREYALSNRILTFGQDNRWRNRVLEAINPLPNAAILDICTGPADLALKIAASFAGSRVYACDFSPRMLEHAGERAGVRRLHIRFVQTDCGLMGFRSASFDCVTVSFGFRNLSFAQENLTHALGEILRVLKNRGRFIIIETSQPQNPLVKRLFHLYAAKVVPWLGRLISGKKEPYSYLGASITKFFSLPELIARLESGGFKFVSAAPFLFGAISLSVFEK